MIKLAVTLVAVALVSIVISSGFAGAKQANGHTAIIRVTKTLTQDSRTSSGIAVSTGRLRSRTGKTIGWSSTVCFDLRNGSAQCVGTYVLPRGKLVTMGTRHGRAYYLFAVVGGTGFYNSAGGTLIARRISFSPERVNLLFVLTLP